MLSNQHSHTCSQVCTELSMFSLAQNGPQIILDLGSQDWLNPEWWAECYQGHGGMWLCKGTTQSASVLFLWQVCTQAPSLFLYKLTITDMVTWHVLLTNVVFKSPRNNTVIYTHFKLIITTFIIPFKAWL